MNKLIATELRKTLNTNTMDMAIYSNRRGLRIPCSYHSGGGKRKTLLPNFDKFELYIEVESYVNVHQELNAELDNYYNKMENFNSSEFIPGLDKWISRYMQSINKKIFQEIIRKNPIAYKKLKGKFPKCIDFLLKNSIDEAGSRNSATLFLGCFFKEFGLDIKDAKDILVEFTTNIPNSLTSTNDYAKIESSVDSVLNTVYNNNEYTFQCYAIKSLIYKRGFQCDTGCSLKE